jgi:hypothetical protein
LSMRDFHERAFTVGIGGPVGSGCVQYAFHICLILFSCFVFVYSCSCVVVVFVCFVLPLFHSCVAFSCFFVSWNRSSCLLSGLLLFRV